MAGCPGGAVPEEQGSNAGRGKQDASDTRQQQVT